MTISPTLFRAILSLDSYNRGYSPGFSGLSGAPGEMIGGATILDIDLPAGSEAAGFYAIAYQVGGQTIISYRGTDNPGSLPNATDILNGYGVAMGGAPA